MDFKVRFTDRGARHEAYHLARNVEYSTSALYIFPVLLPFASFVCSGFISCIPVPHKNRREIIVLDLFEYREDLGRFLHTFSAAKAAATEESTPPDIPTTTEFQVSFFRQTRAKKSRYPDILWKAKHLRFQ